MSKHMQRCLDMVPTTRAVTKQAKKLKQYSFPGTHLARSCVYSFLNDKTGFPLKLAKNWLASSQNGHREKPDNHYCVALDCTDTQCRKGVSLKFTIIS